MAVLNLECGGQIFQISLPDHHTSHEWNNGTPGNDMVNFHPRMFSMLRSVAAENSVLINVSVFYYVKDGEFKVFTGDQINMTPYIPIDSNKAKLVLIGLDTVTNTLTVSEGSEVFDSVQTPPPVPTVPNNFIPSALVKLTTGMTAIPDTNITDARAFLLDPSGSGGASDFLSLTDTPGSFSGEALKTVRVNAGETALEFAEAVSGTAPPYGKIHLLKTDGTIGVYTDLATAFAAASANETIWFAGTHTLTSTITWNKAVNLIGVDRDASIINTSTVNTPIHVTSSNVFFYNFSMQNSRDVADTTAALTVSNSASVYLERLLLVNTGQNASGTHTGLQVLLTSSNIVDHRYINVECFTTLAAGTNYGMRVDDQAGYDSDITIVVGEYLGDNAGIRIESVGGDQTLTLVGVPRCNNITNAGSGGYTVTLNGEWHEAITDELRAQNGLRVFGDTNLKDAVVDGTFEVTSTSLLDGDVDINGNKLYLDADKDSYLEEISDDRIGLYTAAVRRWDVNSSGMILQSGTRVNDIDTAIAASPNHNQLLTALAIKNAIFAESVDILSVVHATSTSFTGTSWVNINGLASTVTVSTQRAAATVIWVVNGWEKNAGNTNWWTRLTRGGSPVGLAQPQAYDPSNDSIQVSAAIVRITGISGSQTFRVQAQKAQGASSTLVIADNTFRSGVMLILDG